MNFVKNAVKRMNKAKQKRSKNRFSWVYNVSKKHNDSLFFILGPCVIESEKHCLFVAEFLTNLASKLSSKFVFKASLDKANRTSISGFRGVGFDQGLKILEKVRTNFDVPIITDVHESGQVDQVTSIVDVVQIPAFLCRQTDLLVAVGNSGKVVNLKKGQFVSPENFYHAYEKIKSTGNDNIWLCERGYSFGYNNLIVDYRNFPIMKRFGCPIVFDVTHAVQRPGGKGMSSDGDKAFVPALAASAIVQNISGIFMEVHNQPEKALSDGPNSIAFRDLEKLLRYFIELDTWSKAHCVPEVDQNFY